MLLSAPAPSYRLAVDAFKRTCRHRVKSVHDMRGDLDRGRRLIQRIVDDDKPDLILAVGPWALDVAVERQSRIPVVYTMVVNPASGPRSKAGVPFCGTSMNVAPGDTFRALREVDPSVRRIVTFYSTEHTAHLIAKAKGVANELGIELIARRISGRKDVLRALNALRSDRMDAFWVAPDPHVLEKRIVRQILLVAFRAKVPVVGLSDAHAEMGATLAVSFADVGDLGSHAGEIANSVLEGESIDSECSSFARKTKIILNLKSARKLGLSVSREFRSKVFRRIE